MFIKVLFLIISNIVFLFVFWRRLKDDYVSNQIFTTEFYILLGITISYLISQRFFLNWWFWLGLLGGLMGLVIGIYRFRLRALELLEAFVIATLPAVFFIYIASYILTTNTMSLLGALSILLMILIFLLLDKHYKSFTWYKSGRIGFSGLTVFGFFFLIRAVVAVAFPSVLSFSGSYETMLSALVAFVSFLGVFTLARQQT